MTRDYWRVEMMAASLVAWKAHWMVERTAVQRAELDSCSVAHLVGSRVGRMVLH